MSSDLENVEVSFETDEEMFWRETMEKAQNNIDHAIPEAMKALAMDMKLNKELFALAKERLKGGEKDGDNNS